MKVKGRDKRKRSFHINLCQDALYLLYIEIASILFSDNDAFLIKNGEFLIPHYSYDSYACAVTVIPQHFV